MKKLWNTITFIIFLPIIAVLFVVGFFDYVFGKEDPFDYDV